MKTILAALLSLSVPLCIIVGLDSPSAVGRAVMLTLAALAAVSLVEVLGELQE